MDISQISTQELKDLLNQIPAELKRRERSERVNLLRDLEKLASERGYSLSDIVSDTKSTKAPVAIKYKHPESNELTWTGRGRKPAWVVEHLNSGGSLESLAV